MMHKKVVAYNSAKYGKIKHAVRESFSLVQKLGYNNQLYGGTHHMAPASALKLGIFLDLNENSVVIDLGSGNGAVGVTYARAFKSVVLCVDLPEGKR